MAWPKKALFRLGELPLDAWDERTAILEGEER